MNIFDNVIYRLWDWFGYWLCEIAFRYWNWNADRIDIAFGLPRLSYQLGCYCYGKGTDAALRCGALVPNPKYPGEHEPRYIWG
jgi:hypothetical protein